MILQKLINSLSKTDDFIKIINLLNRTHGFTKRNNGFATKKERCNF